LLTILSSVAKKKLGLRLREAKLEKPIFATLIMALFLLTFNYFLDINLIYGIIEVLLAVLIYFGVLILTKGVTKEDWNLLKSLIKK